MLSGRALLKRFRVLFCRIEIAGPVFVMNRERFDGPARERRGL